MDSEHETDKSLDVSSSSQLSDNNENSTSHIYIAIDEEENKNVNYSFDENINNDSKSSGSEKISSTEETGTLFQSPKGDGSLSKPKISRELKGLHKAAAESKIITEFTNVKEKKRVRKSLNSPSLNKGLDSGRKSTEILSNEDENDKNHEGDKTPKSNKDNIADMFCWQCHKTDVSVSCKTCPRSFHQRCVRGNITDLHDWCCPECVSIVQAETTDTRSNAMKQVSLSHLCELLKFALKRMTDYLGAEPFLHPVDKNEFPDYAKYVVHPMDLSKLEQNIKKNLYGSTEAFIADTKWILHNSIIYNSIHTKLTSVAKGIIKICKQEMNEIETCPECYLKANTHNDTNWFLEVCSHPHMLVWAKLKGYPYWPAKAMTVSNGNLVDVRFFGAHDKAWIPMKDCLLYSEKDPNFSDKGKRSDFIESLRELAIYVKNLEQKFGKFCHAPFKTPYPNDQAAIYSIMLPSYKFKSDIANKKIITKQKVCDITDKLLEDTKGNMKINNSLDEDSYIEGYDTEDEEALKDVSNESVDNVNDMKIKQTPLRARVRMRGGKINSTGKIKVIKIMKEHMEDQVIESPESMKTEFSSQKNDDNDTKATDTMMHNDSKTNKRKLSTNSLEVQEKKIKPDDIQETVSATPTKNVSKISKEETPEISQSVSVLDNKSDKDEDVNCLVSEHELIPNKVAESNAVNTLTIVNQLPQISIMGVSKSNSVSNKLSPDTNKNTDDIKTNSIARVVLKKRNMIQENSSFVKRVSISKMNSNTETNNKSSVEEHALHRISNIEIKKASPCNAIVIPDSTISSLDVEIKTEPIDDYDIDKSYNASESTTEAYIDNSTKKQSARKSFPNKPKMNISPATKNNSKESGSINPASMVYIPQNSTAPKVEAKYQVSAASSNQQQTSTFVLPKRQEASIKICNTPRNNSSTIDNSTAFKSADLIEEHNYRHTNVPVEEKQENRTTFGPLSTSINTSFPSECGPVSQIINENALKLSRYFQNLLHQTLVDFGNAGSTDAQVKKLQADIESLKWIHKQELSEIKHNTELILLEIRNSFEIDNAHNITKYKKKAEAERIRCVQEAKSKQWCVYCGKEAQFYCCWNTSYCDHECQRKHWNTHMTLCGQHRDTNQDDSSTLNVRFNHNRFTNRKNIVAKY